MFCYCVQYNNSVCKMWQIVARSLVSNPGYFADRANTLPLSYRDTRSYHRQLFTLTLPTYKNMDFWLTDDNIATHGHNFEGSDFTHWAFFNGHIILSKHFGKTPTELFYCLYLK